MTKSKPKEDECVWGHAREEKEEKPKWINREDAIGTKSSWKLNEEPNFSNVHPNDMVNICEHCGENEEDCNCFCSNCGELVDGDCECDRDEDGELLSF